MTKEEYVAKTVGYLISDEDKSTLDGLYSGKSKRIMGLIHDAYIRGIRRGAIAAWQAGQPVTTRSQFDPMKARLTFNGQEVIGLDGCEDNLDLSEEE